ncbi:uncharacterized protein METZ01_LOCUS243962, partial [marine metagenome]
MDIKGFLLFQPFIKLKRKQTDSVSG